MRGALAFAGVLLLAGCAQAEPVAPSNEAACADFAAASLEVGKAVVDGATDIDISGTYDAIAVSATGDVKMRMLKVIDDLPDPEHMIVWIDNREHYSDTLMAVKRACDAEGHDIEVALLVGGQRSTRRTLTIRAARFSSLSPNDLR